MIGRLLKKVGVSASRQVKVPRWDPEWDEDTAEVAYQEALRVQEIQAQWSDSIDTKVAGVFAVSSAIVTLWPSVGHFPQGTPRVFWGVAAICWLLASVCCYLAFRPRAMEIGPNPEGLLQRRWMQLTPHEFRLFRMSEMGESYLFNRDTLDTKAIWLTRAMCLAFAEVFALLLAFSCRQS